MISQLLPIVIGVLFACGCYLVMQRQLVRVLLGLILLGQGANLLIFSGAGLTQNNPPVIPPDALTIEGAAADPLPQALVLTAIVIGFAVLAFAIALVLRTYQKSRSGDINTYTHSED
ncbi:MAG: cation:proton antiporter [Verrucomicrobia bacterium]|nr:MAG: cation:proton antiporter [Verrucomicrobiota bacterium]